MEVYEKIFYYQEDMQTRDGIILLLEKQNNINRNGYQVKLKLMDET